MNGRDLRDAGVSRRKGGKGGRGKAILKFVDKEDNETPRWRSCTRCHSVKKVKPVVVYCPLIRPPKVPIPARRRLEARSCSVPPRPSSLCTCTYSRINADS